MSFLSLLLIGLLLPESLPVAAPRAYGEKKRPKTAEMWQALFSSLGSLLFMVFLASFALTSFFGVFGLYALQKFNAGSETVGTIIMIFGLVTAVAQGLLTGPLTRRWGEALLIQATLVATAAGFLAISLASTLTTFLLAIGWFTLVTALLAPSVSALTSRRATLEQGITMGLSNAAQSLGRIAGPLLGGIAFDLYIEYPNYLGAAVMVAGFLISLLLLKEQRPIKSILSDSGRFP